MAKGFQRTNVTSWVRLLVFVGLGAVLLSSWE